MISFDNTEIAFQSKTDGDLERAYWLFKLVGNSSLVNAGKSLTELAIKLRLPITAPIKATIFRHFCGGETINECNDTIAHLARYNVGTILDYSIEGKESEPEFERTASEIIHTIEKAAGNKNIPFSVFKVTGIGRFSLLEKVNEKKELSGNEAREFQNLKERFNRICAAAAAMNVRLLVDAEESWIQQVIDDLTEEAMEAFNKQTAIIYNTVQLYRHDRLVYLQELYRKGEAKNFLTGVKLVRGAYMEKENKRAADYKYSTPINPTKSETDRLYNEGLKFCIENIHRISICAGTHNEQSSLYLVELMKQKGISPSDPRVFFSQLLGMSDHISFNLANAGYNVAKYVPYGPVKDVVPYLIRRAQENTSVKGQTGRELSLIIKEKRRRKSGKIRT